MGDWLLSMIIPYGCIKVHKEVSQALLHLLPTTALWRKAEQGAGLTWRPEEQSQELIPDARVVLFVVSRLPALRKCKLGNQVK